MSDHNTHHDEHGDGHEVHRPGPGSFEVPLILGSVLWGLVIMIVNIVSCNKCCGEEQCCKDNAACEKTEMHEH